MKNFIILSGGGVKGIAHIAFLENCNLKINSIIGVSAGAFAAALYSFFNGDIKKIKGLESKVFSMDILKKIEEHFANPEHKNIFHTAKTFFDGLKLVKQSSLFQNEEVFQLFYDIFGKIRFEELPIPIYLGAVNLTKGNYTIFSKGELVPAIVASMSVPVVFPPVDINGEYFSDGGFLENIPVLYAYKLGADRTYLSDISGSYKEPNGELSGISLLMNLNNIYSSYLNNLERHFATFVKRFDLREYKWSDFSLYRKIYVSAKKSIKKETYSYKNKGIKKRNFKMFKGTRWNIQ